MQIQDSIYLVFIITSKERVKERVKERERLIEKVFFVSYVFNIICTHFTKHF